ncbi:hypothetical protein CBP36_21510 (plasmid) [Acidovorax carolinensis]|uniref:Uncharacterized protein n=1 Tax=Acidovorax carolinensis TaxID=553814 RepID=A0A240UKE1_9BURK|nr:hypothetical protein [Acidovorax carolinensis]ART61543.1 hypothetical protein CBP36_21510 [Acidovorax carolinensis]
MREERSQADQAAECGCQVSQGGAPENPDHGERLISIIEIDAEVTRRKLIAHAQYQERKDALDATRVPPLAWRELAF